MVRRPQRLTILGSTGSVGCRALDLVSRKKEDFDLVGLSAGRNWQKLAAQAAAFRPQKAAIADAAAARSLKEALAAYPDIEVLSGPQSALEILESPVDIVLGAICGIAGLPSAHRSLSKGYNLALANKESLVCAGELMKAMARRNQCSIFPVDSEHSGVWQLWEEASRPFVEKIILTASGGAFRDKRQEDLLRATPKEALRHPTWRMGPKITIDSATLMNKALEIIEAHVLFDVPYERIEAVLHPQSLVHAFVGYQDGSLLAHMGVRDMGIPIAYALYGGRRQSTGIPLLDPASLTEGLCFGPLSSERYPLFFHVLSVVREVPSASVVLNGGNERAVAAFLEERISYPAIGQSLEILTARFMRQSLRPDPENLEDILGWDRWARAEMDDILKTGGLA